ncbi:glycoprotein-N-acetylgalactosamine 3-beta-galactosyltransferase 1 [Patella vulgata]|uniref:glycoprotein-N-acetylgalactosamine 3-beta-galactosyltransferase 1 n=1 Tax=Patella vulgata TaxID=6465 RepID=UPI0021801A20|nr:glycoprotein-N-acetylgalactosamine 3-beta-galactosyltransferase 1 [Patella vulgata]
MKTKTIVTCILVWAVCLIIYQVVRMHIVPYTKGLQRRGDNLMLVSEQEGGIITGDAEGKNKIHRIFCIIFTIPKNIMKALAVKNTWAKRCDKYLFFSNTTNASLPMAALNMTEGREFLPRKSRLAFEYAYEHYGSDFDWFLKADDDTYVIVENLRHHLKQFNPDEPVYVGKKFSTHHNHTHYMSGGAGYIFSRTAVKSMVSECFLKYSNYFRGGMEDIAVGQCAKMFHYNMVNVSTDALDREKFHSLHPGNYLDADVPEWLYRFSFSKVRTGFDCCSNETISFHYVSPKEIYLIDLFLYHIQIAKT